MIEVLERYHEMSIREQRANTDLFLEARRRIFEYKYNIMKEKFEKENANLEDDMPEIEIDARERNRERSKKWHIINKYI